MARSTNVKVAHNNLQNAEVLAQRLRNSDESQSTFGKVLPVVYNEVLKAIKSSGDYQLIAEIR